MPRRRDITWEETEDGCRICTSHGRDGGGYVNYGIWREGRLENPRLHRVLWEQAHGPVPEGKCLRHRCGNRACINLEHLYLADTGSGVPSGENGYWARLTDAQVREIRESEEPAEVLALRFGMAVGYIQALRLGYSRAAAGGPIPERPEPGHLPAWDLRTRRILAGVQQQAIAAALGCDKSYVCHVEKGRRRLTADEEARYLAALVDIQENP